MAEAHTFEDGDIVDLFLRTDDGEIDRKTVDYLGLRSCDGGPALEYWLYRPDSCTLSVPLDRVIDIELVMPRAERQPDELWTA